MRGACNTLHGGIKARAEEERFEKLSTSLVAQTDLRM
jgi:hypothetical protein